MRGAFVLVGLLLLTGCTTSDPGTPRAGGEPTRTTGTAPTTETTTASRGRPRDVDLAALDVCGLVAALPLASFGLDERPPTGGTSLVFPGAKDCFANGTDRNLSLSLVAVVDQGAAEYVDGVRAEVDEVDADGFSLFVLAPAAPDSCAGALDVDDGQMLFISYGLATPGGEPATPQVTLCQRVHDIARAALTHL